MNLPDGADYFIILTAKPGGKVDGRVSIVDDAVKGTPFYTRDQEHALIELRKSVFDIATQVICACQRAILTRNHMTRMDGEFHSGLNEIIAWHLDHPVMAAFQKIDDENLQDRVRVGKECDAAFSGEIFKLALMGMQAEPAVQEQIQSIVRATAGVIDWTPCVEFIEHDMRASDDPRTVLVWFDRFIQMYVPIWRMMEEKLQRAVIFKAGAKCAKARKNILALAAVIEHDESSIRPYAVRVLAGLPRRLFEQ